MGLAARFTVVAGIAEPLQVTEVKARAAIVDWRNMVDYSCGNYSSLALAFGT